LVFFQKHTIARLLASIFFDFPKKRKKVDAVVCFRTGEDETPKKKCLALALALVLLFCWHSRETCKERMSL